MTKAQKAPIEPTIETDANAVFVRHLLIILIVGIITRILYDWQFKGSLFFGVYQLDDLVIHSWVLDILQGIAPDTAFFRAPLYPYLVAGLYKVFGMSPWPVIIFQNIISIATAIVIYLFARRLFGSTVALWSGLIVALYPTLLIYEGELLNTTLEVFLYTLSVYLMYRAIESLSLRWTIAVGIALGMAAICRPIILPFALFFPILLFLRQRKLEKRIIVLSALFGIALFIPILPVTITNITKGNEFVLISTQGGANFYVGNNAKADGVTVVAPGPNRRVGKYNDNIWTSSVDEAELRTGKTMTQSEVSSYWFNETMHYIMNNPVDAVQLFMKKFYLVFHGQEIINIRSLYYAGEYSWLIRPLLWEYGLRFPSGLLFPFMFVGIFIAVKQRKTVALSVSYLMLIALLIAAFFACARFRQPLIPIASIFAVFAVTYCWQNIRTKRAMFFIGAGIVLCIVLNWGSDKDSKANQAQFQSLIAHAYMDKKNPAAAIPHLEKSMEIMPDNLSIYEITGQAYVETNQADKAKTIFEHGLSLYPAYAPFHGGLGEIAFLSDNREAAKRHFQTALTYSPVYEFALDQLTQLYVLEQQYDSALIYCQRHADVKGGTDRTLQKRIATLQRQIDEANQEQSLKK